MSEQFQNQIQKSQKEENLYLHNTQIHNRSLLWPGTGTSMKSDGVKIVY